MSFSRLLLITLFCMLPMNLSGCSDSGSSLDLSGYWEGEIHNSATRQSWDAFLYIEQSGDEINGIYWDEWESRTIRNVTLEDDTIGFVIDIYPEIVTFFGDVHNESYLSGTWSYSGDGTNGEWHFEKKSSGRPDGNIPPDSSSFAGDTNPFSGHL